MLGPTYDYTQRLLDFPLLADAGEPRRCARADAGRLPARCRACCELLAARGPDRARRGPERTSAPADLTREPLRFPATAPARLQKLARGDEGLLLAMGYSTQRGYAQRHPFAGEIRRGTVAVEMVPDELGFAIDIGDIEVTECQMINQFAGSARACRRSSRTATASRSAAASARRWRWRWWTARCARANSARRSVARRRTQEFVLSHSDSVEASGFVQHLKLPHYVDFQSELELVRTPARGRTRAQRRREQHERKAGLQMRRTTRYNFAYLDEQTKKMIRRAS